MYPGIEHEFNRALGWAQTDGGREPAACGRGGEPRALRSDRVLQAQRKLKWL